MAGITRCAAAALAACSLLAVSSAARGEVAVVSGHSVSLMTTSSLDQTCHSLGPVTVNVLEQPRGGYLLVEQTRAYPAFNALNTHSRCNTIKVPATRVIYQSSGNFLGLDFATVELIFPEGGVRRVRLAISVRPLGPGMPVPHDSVRAPPPAAGAPVTEGALTQGPLGGEVARPPAAAKAHIHHAKAHPAQHPKCDATCAAANKRGTQPAPRPPEGAPPATLLTPI